MKGKITGFLIAVVLIAAIVAMPVLAAGITPFTDIEMWAKEYIETAYKYGFVNGVTETSFEPDAPMTRAMAITVLYRHAVKIFGVSPPVLEERELPFTDVNPEAYYYDAVVWAYGNELTNGTSETTFSPDEPLKRQDWVKLLYSETLYYLALDDSGIAVDFPHPDIPETFIDRGEVSYYAINAVRWAIGQQIMSGKSEFILDPQGAITRAEAIKMKFCNYGPQD